MKKAILGPQGKVIKSKRFEEDNILIDGLMICLDKMTKMGTAREINDYLLYGSNDDIDIKEEVARLLLLATSFPSNISPALDIGEKIMANHIVDINSMFMREFLEIDLRSKKSSFMNSNFYDAISSKVKEMESKDDMNVNFYLNNGIILNKNLRNLYIANLDKNIKDNKLEVKFREPLIELFQYNLDYTLNKLKNGVIKNVQVQTRYQ
ncbi:MAG: hypothetical protein IKH54_06885 [Bacilli bacterium]|nr:hypothetical protein [Bacilli bacterium]